MNILNPTELHTLNGWMSILCALYLHKAIFKKLTRDHGESARIRHSHLWPQNNQVSMLPPVLSLCHQWEQILDSYVDDMRPTLLAFLCHTLSGSIWLLKVKTCVWDLVLRTWGENYPAFYVKQNNLYFPKYRQGVEMLRSYKNSIYSLSRKLWICFP